MFLPVSVRALGSETTCLSVSGLARRCAASRISMSARRLGGHEFEGRKIEIGGADFDADEAVCHVVIERDPVYKRIECRH